MSNGIGLLRLTSRCVLVHPSTRHVPQHPRFSTRIVATGNQNNLILHSTASYILSTLKSSNDNSRTSAIHAYYPTLIAQFQRVKATSQDAPSPLSKSQFIPFLMALAASGKPADLQRLEQMLSDMHNVFGIHPDPEIHTAIIRGLIKYGKSKTVFSWLQKMHLRPGNLTPSLEQVHTFLEACVNIESFKYMRTLVNSMRSLGCKPTNKTFEILLNARWVFADRAGEVPPVITFTTLIQDMKKHGLRYDPDISALLHDSYAQRDWPTYAQEIQAYYILQFPNDYSFDEQQQMVWNVAISDAALKGGAKNALEMFKSLEPSGCQATPDAIRAILRHSLDINDIRLVQKELSIQCTVDHWSLVINNNVRANTSRKKVLAYYKAAKAAGMIPDAALVAPIIRTLCRSKNVAPVKDQYLDEALAIYRDLVEAAPVPSTSESVWKESYEEHSAGPDPDIYHTLLRALVTSRDPQKYGPIALSLVEDMQARSIPTKDSTTTSLLIVINMRSASSLAEALKAYKKLRSSLDPKGYELVLKTFCKLSFKKDGDRTIEIPSLTDYFGIVKDMRRAGVPITEDTYTTYVKQLGIIATEMRDADIQDPFELRGKLLTALRRTHDLLTLDAAVSPEAKTWTALIDTYQRLGYFGDAYRVWEMVYLSSRFNEVTVSVILDACGFAGAYRIAKTIVTNLTNDGHTFTLHNWNSWIECLCRLRRLNDAVKVACVDMRNAPTPVEPDTSTINILLKFSRVSGQQAEVLERIERHLPSLWSNLPQELRTP